MKNFLIFVFVNFKIIFSLSLEKYGKIETEYNTILFDSSQFNLGDKIEFKFTTNYYCENILHYQFYDEYNKVYRFYQTNYSVICSKESIEDSKNLKYFDINKENEVLNGLDGNYLLLKYNCTGLVEIENISHRLKTGYIVLIVIVVIIIIIVVIFVTVYFCRKKNIKNNEEIDNKLPNPNNENENEVNNNNNNINNNINTIQVLRNNNEINNNNPESSNRMTK